MPKKLNVHVFRYNVMTNLLGDSSTMLRDGRTASKFVEQITPMFYPDFIPFPNDSKEGDGMINGGCAEVRTITKGGVYFQKSINIGGSRRCSKKELNEAVQSKECYILYDVKDAPMIKTFMISAKYIDSLLESGDIPLTGKVAHSKIWNLVKRDFNLVENHV